MNVDGVEIAFEPAAEGGETVRAGGRVVGRLAPAPQGEGYVAYRESGHAIERASQWGGTVTMRFASRELAVRALLSKA